MNTFKLFLVLVSFSALFMQRAEAHNSIISTYNIEYTEQSKWILKVSVPLAGLHEALLKHHSKNELLPESGKYNETLAVEYLQQNSEIKVNANQLVQLKVVNVELSNHQSSFVFELTDMPNDVRNFDFHLPAMSENIGHVNIARVKWVGFSKKVVLNYSNNYAGSLLVKRETSSGLNQLSPIKI